MDCVPRWVKYAAVINKTAGGLFQIARLQPHPQRAVPVAQLQSLSDDLLRCSGVECRQKTCFEIAFRQARHARGGERLEAEAIRLSIYPKSQNDDPHDHRLRLADTLKG